MLSFSSSLWMFRALHHDLVNLYWISVSQLPRYAPFVLSISLSCLNSWFIIAFVARAGCTSWVWTTYPSGAPELTPGVKWDSLCPIFSFLRSILWIVVYPFVPFCLVIVCLSFNLWIPITLLVPSSSSLTVYDGCYKWSRHWLPFRSSRIHRNSLQLLSEFRLPRSLYLLLVST